ncbi:MAG TPA: uroporphyrinogen decarboxylase [Ktedonosporobacter sp.]|jgi:uroporphyrinogen decarboxylase|nr:uroporphyrinogen decarboxylase [Ktedonosporobacter sp.]
MQQQTSPSKPAHTGLARFLDACHLRQPDATPIWFMRQAGRCLAEYRDLRKKYGIIEMAKTPELCTMVTLMPVHTFGVDAAVLYADIMLPLEDMGVPFEIQPEVGPIIRNPIRTLKDVEALRTPSGEEVTPYVMAATSMVRRELAGKQAVIGFAGSPFTLACYMIEGRPSRDYALAKAFMYGQPEAWHLLMDKLSKVIADYLVAQVRAGADVVQLFDSWIGAISPSVYRRYVQPYIKRIFAEVKTTDAPSIHFGTGTAALLEAMTEAGGDVISVDWRVDLDDAWARIGYDHGIQGNLDPTVMLTSWPIIEDAMNDILQRANNRAGHIFNLGHGVLAPTDPGLLRQLVDAVRETTKRA